MAGDDLIESMSLKDVYLITKLVRKYQRGVDNFDWDLWITYFAEDAIFNTPNLFGLMSGQTEIYTMCKGGVDAAYQSLQHHVTNLDIDLLDESKAVGYADLILVGVPDKSFPQNYDMSGGRYKFQFGKSLSGWKISRIDLDILWKNEV